MATIYRVGHAGAPADGPPPTIAIVLAGFAAFLNLYATQPLLPMLADVFAASHVAVSLTITAATIAVALGAPVVGRIADRAGLKRVIVWSVSLLAATTMLAASSGSLNQLIGWRFVQGLVTPGIFAITMAYIHEEWPAARVGRATAAYVSGTVLGGFTGRAAAGFTASRAGWSAAFVVLGVLTAIAAAAVWRWLPRERQARRHHGQDTGPGSLARIFRNRQLVATYAVGFCVLFTQTAMFTYVTFHLEAPPFGLSTAALGSLFVVYLVGAAVMPLGGQLIDRFGARVGLATGMGIGAAGALLTLGPLAAVVVGLTLVSTGVFISQATSSTYIGASTSSDRGLAVGLYAMFYYAGGSLGAAVPGIFWDRGGWLLCVALVVGVQALTVTMALAFWGER